MSSRSLTRTALLLLPFQIVLRTSEALLPLALAAWFGKSAETDAYYLSAAFFIFAGTLVSSGFQDSALIPILTELRARDRALYPRVTGSLLGHVLVFGTSGSLALGLFVLGLLRLTMPSVPFGSLLLLVVPFTLQLVLMGYRSLSIGLLNSEGRFFVHPIVSGLGMTVTLFAIYFVKKDLGVPAIAISLASGEAVAAALAGAIAFRLVKIPVAINLTRPEPIRRFFRLVTSEVSGSAITRLNPIVDQAIAQASLVVGGGTMLKYAFDIASVPASLAQAAILPPLLSRLSELATAGNERDFRKTIVRSLVIVCGVLALLSFAMSVFGGPLCRLVFLHGAMDSAGVDGIVRILPYALAGAAPFGALLILARAHVAIQNSRIMIPMGIFNAALNLAFNLAFVKIIGLGGIALSTSAMHAAVAVAFWMLLPKRWKRSH